jgi:hypothetical protein
MKCPQPGRFQREQAGRRVEGTLRAFRRAGAEEIIAFMILLSTSVTSNR